MFLLPQGDSEMVEGQSDKNPVILQGVSKTEFESLLRALMDRQHGTQKRSKLDHNQWISVLKLSTMWEFNNLRNVAIQYLDVPSGPLGPVDKFALASKYEIKKWLLPALSALARRSEPISVEEGRCIGFENALKLAAVREKLAAMREEVTATKVLDWVQRNYTVKPRDEESNEPRKSGRSMRLRDRRPAQRLEDEDEGGICTSLITKAFNL
ncbi:hypothetical protein EDC04DRAFT_1459879 [Pisolithus marmoratus]|nr:hypothetical protein EDC04DRAFT_1459879 [Pisolithus marmoratus]